MKARAHCLTQLVASLGHSLQNWCGMSVATTNPRVIAARQLGPECDTPMEEVFGMEHQGALMQDIIFETWGDGDEVQICPWLNDAGGAMHLEAPAEQDSL